jgi:hypothetical protein
MTHLSTPKSPQTQPRAEIAQKRIALGKLSKDFERVKTIVVTMVGEANSIKVVKDGNGKQASSSSVFRMESSNSEGGSGGAGPQKLSQGKMTFTQQMAGQDVDDMIMEERERDIKKMNQDLLLVNEMFKDMAEIVEKQGGNIEKVAETTDVSHERAKAGLDQVKQAAESQQGCVIS